MSLQRETFLRQQAIQARCFHLSSEWEAFPQSVLEGSIGARFEEMAARYPEQLAVKMGDEQLTYRTLNTQADQVAQAVGAQASDQERPVILLFAHAPVAVIAMLGVLKAGRFYAPFDPTQPLERLIQRATHSQAALLLTDLHHLPLAAQMKLNDVEILCIEPILAEPFNKEKTNVKLTRPLGGAANALLLYTSGSTGAPKGILLSQRALLHRVKRQTEIAHISSKDRCAALHTYDTIAGLRDLFCPLLTGATVCLFNLKERTLAELPGWMQQEEITLLGMVTPTFRHLLNQVPPAPAFAKVRLLWLGGDTLYWQDVIHYRQHFPPTCILFNTFGATETAGSFCYYLFDHTSLPLTDPLPVGYPMLDMQISVVDDDGRSLPSGTIGEIALTTAYLAQGYWQQPRQTAERFLPAAVGATYLTGDSGLLQADGCLIHLGRKDRQIKRYGYRVEMDEVERMLLSLPWVQEAAVVMHTPKPDETQMVAYWVAKPGMTATTDLLRGLLSAKLPTYMLPDLFVTLDRLPLTPSGKIDRKVLPEPALSAYQERPLLDTPYQAARTPLEARLVAIWQDVLAIEPVGVDDHFLGLGGNSLRAMQIHARLASQLSSDLPIRVLFECATVAEMALLLTQQAAMQLPEDALAELLTEIEA